jgi:hypothetical protein
MMKVDGMMPWHRGCLSKDANALSQKRVKLCQFLFNSHVTSSTLLFPFLHKPLSRYIQLKLLNSKFNYLRPLETTQPCPLLLPVTLPLVLPLSLLLHLHSPELLARSLPSKQQSIDNANGLAGISADQNTYRNVFETPGVRNVADRYAAQGGTTTHLPGVATPLGMFAVPIHGCTAERLLICGTY